MKTKPKFDLVTIGDATWDLFLKIHDAEARCSKNHQHCVLALDYGGKISVDQLHSSVGGNAANIAVATAKLGIKTAFVGFVGEDDSGKKALKIIQKSKVNTDYAICEGQTNQSAIISFQGERTILSYKEPRPYNLVKIPESDWVFFTSTGPGSEKALSKILKILEKRKFFFNPGSYHLKLGNPFLKKILKQAYGLIVNLEEAQGILEKKPKDLREILFDLAKFGPKIVLVTNGKEGAYATCDQKFYKISSLDVKVIDPTGAGDSFSAAFVAAIILGKDIKEAMQWGIYNSVAQIKVLGTQAGVLDLADIKHWAKKYQHQLEVREF